MATRCGTRQGGGEVEAEWSPHRPPLSARTCERPGAADVAVEDEHRLGLVRQDDGAELVQAACGAVAAELPQVAHRDAQLRAHAGQVLPEVPLLVEADDVDGGESRHGGGRPDGVVHQGTASHREQGRRVAGAQGVEVAGARPAHHHHGDAGLSRHGGERTGEGLSTQSVQFLAIGIAHRAAPPPGFAEGGLEGGETCEEAQPHAAAVASVQHG